MSEDQTEVDLKSRDSAREIIPVAMENACAGDSHDHDAVQHDPDKELPELAQLSEETPELNESIRECDLLSQVLLVHSQISTRLTGRINDEADAIGRGFFAL